MKTKNKREAFGAFVREHQAPLRGFLRVLGVRQDSVDDLAQETFLVAYRELDSFREDEDFGKWLRGIARNLVRNETRKTARRCRITDNELTDHMLAHLTPDRADTRYEEFDFRALRDCLEQLPDKSRQMVSGRYMDEWNASYLADQFEMSATAVRLALMRIRKQLRGCIRKRVAGHA